MAKVAKAIIAAVTGGSGALVTALADGTLSPVETIAVAATAIVAFFGVWATTNAPQED